MRLILLLWRREWMSMVRNPFLMILLSATFVLGIYSIYYGHSKIKEQYQTISAVENIEFQEFKNYQESFKKTSNTIEVKQTLDIASNPAFAWYRHGYHAILHPQALSHLSLGQRDVEPYYYKLTAMSLYYQLFENEIANPLKLYVGNFDLSFVLIYLFPLLIISLTYGLYAEEKENGILPLLRLQTKGLKKILLIRLAYYFIVIAGLGIILSIIGFLTSVTSNILANGLWFLTVISYCGFWFAMMFFLVSLKKNSSLTAITAAVLWLLFLIILPSFLNTYTNFLYPIDNTTLVDVTRRKSLENEDDLNEAKHIVFEYLHHREDLIGADSLINTNTMAKTYAAFTALNDINHKKEVSTYFKQIESRQRWLSFFRWLNPAVNSKGIFNEIARTDSKIFQSYYESIQNFHQDITNFYFKRLFLNKEILIEDYHNLPRFNLEIDNKSINRNIIVGLITVLITSFLFFGISLVLFTKITS